ncbi:MAG: sialate O-acetylesterase [Planctomycetaceae bacterium]|jgi:sialate O-acetylesterase|nr:sialate O-acetylesterase [Planctomycetaceae bacterium]
MLKNLQTITFFIIVAVFCQITEIQADVSLPAVFGDNMVLQRDLPNPVWGKADPDEEITVSIAGQVKKTTANTDGKWLVELDPLKTGDVLVLTVKGKNVIQFKNVLVGEVWVCSGQSNMFFTVARGNDAEKEIAAADYPNIRLLKVSQHAAKEPQDNFEGKWELCSPQTVSTFTAAGYFFGRNLHKELNGIPIGLIQSAWGGSSCEAWIPQNVIESDTDAQSFALRHKNFERQKENSTKRSNNTAQNNRQRPAGIKQHQLSSLLYNGMIHPFERFGIRGVIWYQGEANATRAYQYRRIFPLLIQSWRNVWRQGDFPFYYVQLANFRKISEQPSESAWAELREAQNLTLSVTNTGQAVAIDIGEADDIHPKNKQEIGRRLALWALAKDYGKKDIVFSGPVYQSFQIDGNKIVLTFEQPDNDLTAKGLTIKGDQLKGFAIAGEDKKFVWADAKIVGQTIEVSAEGIDKPIAVRYGWGDNPVVNLYNNAGLPASPFRTDHWQGITVNAK